MTTSAESLGPRSGAWRRLPVIHQVLTCKDEEQARIRCVESKYNRGTEAARTAVAMSNLLAQLRE